MLAEFPNRIKEHRKRRGMTAKQLADQLGTTEATMSRLEGGKQSLSQQWLEKLSISLEVDVADIISGSGGSLDRPLMLDALRDLVTVVGGYISNDYAMQRDKELVAAYTKAVDVLRNVIVPVHGYYYSVEYANSWHALLSLFSLRENNRRINLFSVSFVPRQHVVKCFCVLSPPLFSVRVCQPQHLVENCNHFAVPAVLVCERYGATGESYRDGVARLRHFQPPASFPRLPDTTPLLRSCL